MKLTSSETTVAKVGSLWLTPLRSGTISDQGLHISQQGAAQFHGIPRVFGVVLVITVKSIKVYRLVGTSDTIIIDK